MIVVELQSVLKLKSLHENEVLLAVVYFELVRVLNVPLILMLDLEEYYDMRLCFDEDYLLDLVFINGLGLLRLLLFEL
jgi:hypothetical protein